MAEELARGDACYMELVRTADYKSDYSVDQRTVEAKLSELESILGFSNPRSQLLAAKAFAADAQLMIEDLTIQIEMLRGCTDSLSLRQVSSLLRLQTKLTIAIGRSLKLVSQSVRQNSVDLRIQPRLYSV